jgi:SRSO17 transposase
VPESVTFQTKPEIALDQIRAALQAQIPPGVVLMDAGYGADTTLRTGVSALGLTYVAGVQPHISVWTRTNPPPQVKPWSGRGQPPTRLRRDPHHVPQSAKDIALSLPAQAWTTITWREGSLDPLTSRFARLRVRAAHRDYHLGEPRAEEWLLIEWPPEEKEPTKYWLSTLPEDIAFDRLVHLAKLRWRIERDYQELKQELGLGHYEGRGWRGFHHHATLCIAAYAFLVAERAMLPPSGRREAAQRTAPRISAGYQPGGAPNPAGAPRGALHRNCAAEAYDSPGPPP